MNLSQSIKRSIKSALLFVIKMYQVFLSSFSMPSCKYHPTCSCYAQESILKHGSIKGIILTFLRIIRCHPLTKGGYDPVPKNFIRLNPNYVLRGYNDK